MRVEATVETVVVQMKEDFLGRDFLSLPEMVAIKDLLTGRDRPCILWRNKTTSGGEAEELAFTTSF
jgi:hypothetical protein